MSGAETYLRSIETDALGALRRLVDVNSYTFHRAGVVRVGELCEEMFSPLGFAARRVRSVTNDCGDHLFLTRGGKGDVELVLVAHLDTVYPAEEEERHDFRWREEGRRIYGPGVADIKGGIVLIWMALRALQATAPEVFERVTWRVLLNASEEGGCADFPALARELVTPATRACLVYEAGFEADAGATTIAVARRGSGRFRVQVLGREAHSGNAHEQGANAVRELAGVIERIEALTDYARGLTFNVGKVEGGTAVNSVPGHAACEVDMRAWTPDDFEAGRGQVLALAGEGAVRSREGGHVCRVEVIERPGYPPWLPDAKSDQLGALVIACATELGQKVVTSHRKGGSDAAHLYDLVPTVDALGPVGRNVHCSFHDPARGREQESADRKSFVERALLSVAVFSSLAAS